MKKIQLFLVAAIMVAVASAFTGAPKKDPDPLYKAVYLGTDFDWVLIDEEEGICNFNEEHFCEARFATTPSANQVPTVTELVGRGDFM